MIQQVETPSSERDNDFSPEKTQSNTTRRPSSKVNTDKGPSPSGLLLKRSMLMKNLPKEVLSHALDSWREKTKLQYAVYHRRWNTYCILKNIDTLNPQFNQVLSFLVSQFDLGLRYSALNSIRSALSCVLPHFEGFSFGTHPNTLRLLKSFYNKRPPQARYAEMWNPDTVLDFLREKTPLNSLSLKDLTLKFCMLFLLATCARQQKLCMLKRSNIKFQPDGSVKIVIDELQKHSSKGKSLEVLQLSPFSQDKSICVVNNLKVYLHKTKEVTNAGNNLLCSFKPPYKAVGTQTIARWIKTTMKDAGIGINVFKAHSTRGSSASHLVKVGNTPS